MRPEGFGPRFVAEASEAPVIETSRHVPINRLAASPGKASCSLAAFKSISPAKVMLKNRHFIMTASHCVLVRVSVEKVYFINLPFIASRSCLAQVQTSVHIRGNLTWNCRLRKVSLNNGRDAGKECNPFLSLSFCFNSTRCLLLYAAFRNQMP